MTKLSRNQRGFTVLEGLLVAVIAGIVGFTGWYVLHTQNSTDKILSNSSKTPSQKKTQSKSTDKSQLKILSFDEWGVKASLSKDVPEVDVSYIRNTGEDTFYAITTKQPVYDYVENGKTYSVYADVRLYRTPTNHMTDQDKPTQYQYDEIVSAKSIGKYYYQVGQTSADSDAYRSNGQGPDSDNGTIENEQASLQKRQKIEADIIQSLKGLR